SNFREFESSLNGESQTPVHELRKNAIVKLNEIDFPTTKNEEWKYTNIAPILNYKFQLADEISLGAEDIQKFLIKDCDVHLAVLVNGRFKKELSSIGKLPKGVIVQSLFEAIKSKPELVFNYLGKYVNIENGFIALNTAFTLDGVFIYVPDNVVVDKQIHILHLTGRSKENILAQPRNLLAAGKNSVVRLIESYNSISSSVDFTNVVTEIIAGENSHVEIYKIQNEDKQNFHINRTQVEQKNGSTFTTYTASLGSAIIRNDLNTVLDGEGCTANLYGLYIIDGTQHVDNHTLIDHAKPHCQSNELYKGVLNGKSRGVFNGKVFVRKDAQKTNAYQSNKAMLLSNEALIDTKPQLEIYADDVKCSHGAAIGQLDEESVFYLRTRGIGEEKARAVLIRAFANDVFELIEDEPLHNHLNALVFEKLTF
ncbi:MAG TPA: Fe-S cluster assembly protein SufD, partial [Ignavibacteria bacterium]